MKIKQKVIGQCKTCKYWDAEQAKYDSSWATHTICERWHHTIHSGTWGCWDWKLDKKFKPTIKQVKDFGKKFEGVKLPKSFGRMK